MFGRFVEEKLAGGGVDLCGLQRLSGHKTGLTIWYSRENKRSGLTYPGTISLLERSHISTALLRRARHLHVGHYFLQTCLHRDAPELFAEAKALGLTTSLDCNYDPREQWDSNLRQVLLHTDVFLPNEDEAIAITGAADYASAARELLSQAQIVIVKRGAHGVFAASRTASFETPAIPVQAIDTTGAGDSFNAGFLVEFVKGQNLETCVKSGIRAAARSVQKVGGTAAFEE
jgi:sugar/nucleoside kinase (ribokinase family)